MKVRFSLVVLFLCCAVMIAQTKDEETLQENADVPVAVVEQVPVFPGCEKGTNAEQRDCLVQMIHQHVVQHFDKGRIEAADLPPGKYRIAVQFKIDEYGNAVDIRSRASHEVIEAEAIRVVGLLPQMIPGEQRGKKVGVLYAIPILFEIEPPKRIKRQKAKNNQKSGSKV